MNKIKTLLLNPIDPKTGWKTVRGEFICVNAALVAGICSKTPHGVSPTAHLGNGCVDLVLVKKCSRINYLRHMLRLASGANHVSFCSVYLFIFLVNHNILKFIRFVEINDVQVHIKIRLPS